MPPLPIPLKRYRYYGPHNTCMYSGYIGVPPSNMPQSKYDTFDIYIWSPNIYNFTRFMMCLGTFLLIAALWVFFCVLFIVQYILARLFLRLQYKLSIVLLLMGYQRMDFSLINDIILSSMQVTMFFVVVLSWAFMMFMII